MSQGQRRSSRELKKPNQHKAKTPASAAAAGATFWSTIDKLQSKGAGKK
jgi:hypothetical protein